jgi:hypothetical protein
MTGRKLAVAGIEKKIIVKDTNCPVQIQQTKLKKLRQGGDFLDFK